MSHLSHYLKSLMKNIDTTNGQLLQYRRGISVAKSNNGLTSVKLTKIRDAIEKEAKHVIEAFDGIGQRHAVIGDDEKPVVITKDGLPLNWTNTGTPCYEIDEAKKTEYIAELSDLDQAAVMVHTLTLTDTDLAWISSKDETVDMGPALAAFSDAA